MNRPLQNTLSVNCHGDEKPQRVLSPVALSEGETWRAYSDFKYSTKSFFSWSVKCSDLKLS